MSVEIVRYKCPHCGNEIHTGMTTCDYCDQAVNFQSFHSVASMSMPELNKYANSYKQALAENPDNVVLNKSIAMCYLKLKQYKQAAHYFEAAMRDNFDDVDNYLYAAICLLEGKKAFLANRQIIDKIEIYINDAVGINPMAIHYYFWAYIKYDYFNRKSFRTSPTYLECLDMANQMGISELDKQELFEALNVPRPEGF